MIYELGWATKEWRHVLPIGDDLPWSRTYHVAELVYPFLIIHGGEGVANIDLDDCWVFNLIGRKWTEVPMKQGSRPCERRFHSSTVLKDKLYIIGGCKGNY